MYIYVKTIVCILYMYMYFPCSFCPHFFPVLFSRKVIESVIDTGISEQKMISHDK